MKMTQKMNWIKLILCAMFVCMAHVVSAQQVAVRGQVLDAGTKEPMIGVSVLEKERLTEPLPISMVTIR